MRFKRYWAIHFSWITLNTNIRCYFYEIWIKETLLLVSQVFWVFTGFLISKDFQAQWIKLFQNPEILNTHCWRYIYWVRFYLGLFYDTTVSLCSLIRLIIPRNTDKLNPELPSHDNVSAASHSESKPGLV